MTNDKAIKLAQLKKENVTMRLAPLKRRRAATPLNILMNELDNLFSAEPNTSDHYLAPVDVQHTDDDIIIKMDVPGVQKDKITVDFEDGVLTIAGEKEDQAENNINNRVYSERRYGRFERRLSVGRYVDFKNALATVEHGVLSVRLPKLEAKKIESRIPIK